MTGRVLELWTAPAAAAPMVRSASVQALAGVGLAGDRYALGGGTWADYPLQEKQLTLIDAAEVAAVAREVGVPLTPGRSVAVDPQSVPYGTPVWLDTTEPLGSTPLRRAAMAQDTGSAIVGAVRADFFWGWGDTAEQQAGRMKQPLRMWALWPRPAP